MQHMYLFMRKTIFIIWELLMLWTAFLFFGCYDKLNLGTSKTYLYVLENAGFLFFGIAVLSILFFINKTFGTVIEEHLKKFSVIYLIATLVILTSTQILFTYGGYFDSGWDAGKVRETVFYIVNGEYDSLDNDYFSWFPNNLFLVWLYVRIIKFAALFMGTSDALVFSLIVFQIIVDVVAMWLVYRITYDISRSMRVTWFAYIVAFIFVGLSPWFIVPYSDGTSFATALIIIRLYQIIYKNMHKRKLIIILGLCLGIVSVIGYYIKPQTAIAFIAVIIVTLLNLIKIANKKILQKL